MDFQAFPKMARLSREMIVTEKIDGTNAQVFITELEGYPAQGAVYQKDGLALFAGSRTRWITPENDNYGFAAWCRDNAEELLGLGIGRHFGEWWGKGIQRGYGLNEKRFSLFNVSRWNDPPGLIADIVTPNRPECCHVVPILWRGKFDTFRVEEAVNYLKENGSVAAPGFMRPEGVIVWHTAGNFGMKKTLEKDEVPKSTWGAK